MLTLTPTEIRVIRVWSESGEKSPFPREAALAHRIKEAGGYQTMKFNVKEIEIILHWSEKNTMGHHGTDQFLLEQEAKLLSKIEAFLEEKQGGLLGL